MDYAVSSSRPAPIRRAARPPLYPFNLLETSGQSIVLPGDVNVRRLTSAAHAYAKRHGWRAVVRRLPDGSMCVWRLSPDADAAPLLTELADKREAADQARKREAREAREQTRINKLRKDIGTWLCDRYAPASIDAIRAAFRIDLATTEQVLAFWRDLGRIVDTPDGVRWLSSWERKA